MTVTLTELAATIQVMHAARTHAELRGICNRIANERNHLQKSVRDTLRRAAAKRYKELDVETALPEETRDDYCDVSGTD